MQIVIDISNYDAEWISNGYWIPEEINCKIADAIITGVKLPKGHGRLIDADALKIHKYHSDITHENAVAIAQIDWMPTIIEADKAESEVT